MELCQYHLQDQFGPLMASHLSSPLYYKQIEYTDKKGEQRKKRWSGSPCTLCKLIYSEKSNKISSPFTTKGKQKVGPFDYLNQ